MLSLALVLGVTACNKKEEKVEEKPPVEQVQPKDDLNGRKPSEIDSSINYDEYVDTKDKLIKVIKKCTKHVVNKRLCSWEMTNRKSKIS